MKRGYLVKYSMNLGGKGGIENPLSHTQPEPYMSSYDCSIFATLAVQEI